MSMSELRPDGSMPNVMIVSPEYPPNVQGGLGTHVMELTRGLGKAGCKVTVLTPVLGPARLLREGNVSVHQISMRGIPYDESEEAQAKWFQACHNRGILYGQRLIARERNRPDIIHCHDWTSFSSAFHVGLSAKVPVVGSVHLLYNPLRRWWGEPIHRRIALEEEKFCKKCTALITVSNSMREIIHDTYGVSRDLIHVIYNGFDSHFFLQDVMPTEQLSKFRERFASPDEQIVLFAGRLSAQKGIAPLLASVAQVISKRPTARYVIAGGHGTSDAAEITEVVKSFYSEYSSIWNNVQFLGKVAREEIAALYQIADIAVVPSIYEPFGYATTEAMAAGVPVVATDAGGLSEIVVDGQTGILVPIRANEKGMHELDVEKLAEAQLTLLDDPEMRKRMGEAGRERVLQNFSLQAMIDRTIDVYKKLIKDYRDQQELEIRGLKSRGRSATSV